MFPLFHKEARGEIGYDPSFDLRIEGKVEPLQGLLFFKGCLLYSDGELLRLPSLDLILDDEGEEDKVGEFVFLRLDEPESRVSSNPPSFSFRRLAHEVVINHDAPRG